MLCLDSSIRKIVLEIYQVKLSFQKKHQIARKHSVEIGRIQV